MNNSVFNLLEDNKCSSGFPWKVNVELSLLLAKLNLSHLDKCLLCDQEEETVQHNAHPYNLSLQDSFGTGCWLHLTWWRRASKRVSKDQRRGVNTLIILDAWMLCKQRNACVFEGDSQCPSLLTPRNLKLEARLWTLSGASKLQGLGLSRLEI